MLTIRDLLRRKSEYRLYDSCETLPLMVFIKLCQTGDGNVLILSGKPSQTVINDAVEAINEEYTQLVNSTGSQKLLALSKQIAYLTNKINTIVILVAYMYKRFSQDLADKLNEYGFCIPYNKADLEKQLQLTITHTKGYQFELNGLLSEYEAMKDKQGGNTSWSDLLADIETELGFAMPSDTTVTRYVGYYNKYKQKRSA